MPEFLERRFSPSARWVLSGISLVACVLTKIAVGIFAGGVVFGTLIPEMSLTIGGMTFNSFWIGSVSVVVLIGLYTVHGGMRAVAYTEAVQTFILIAGSVLLTLFGFEKIGGWSAFRAALPSDMFNLWKPLIPAGVEGTWAPVKEAGRMAWYFNTNYPWVGMLLCAPIVGLWYWCTDQYIVQRTLGAPNETEARRGSIFASFLKLLPVFIFIIPGMLALKAAGFEGGYAAGSFLWVVNNIYFQYYSLLVFVVSAAVFVGVSYATEPPSEAQLTGLTYATGTEEQRQVTRRSWTRGDVFASCIVVVPILCAYLYFNG